MGATGCQKGDKGTKGGWKGKDRKGTEWRETRTGRNEKKRAGKETGRLRNTKSRYSSGKIHGSMEGRFGNFHGFVFPATVAFGVAMLTHIKIILNEVLVWVEELYLAGPMRGGG